MHPVHTLETSHDAKRLGKKLRLCPNGLHTGIHCIIAIWKQKKKKEKNRKVDIFSVISIFIALIETKTKTSFPALSVSPRVGISLSASETDDRFYFSSSGEKCLREGASLTLAYFYIYFCFLDVVVGPSCPLYML